MTGNPANINAIKYNNPGHSRYWLGYYHAMSGMAIFYLGDDIIAIRGYLHYWDDRMLKA